MNVAVNRQAVDDGALRILRCKVLHELFLRKVVLIDPRIGLINQPLQVLILFHILLHSQLFLRQFYIDYVEKDFGTADLIGLTLDNLPELIVLHLDESAVDAAHVLDVEVPWLPQI